MRHSFSLSILLLLSLFTHVGQISSVPYVVTDKTTYYQGESILFTGQGFTPNNAASACLTTDNTGTYVCPSEVNADGQGNVAGSMLVGLNIPVGPQQFYVKDQASGLESNRVQLQIIQQPFDFKVTASSNDVVIVQGDTGYSTISVTLTSGLPQTVSLACSSVLINSYGASCNFNPSSGTPTQGWSCYGATCQSISAFSSQLTITTLSSTQVGVYTLTVNGANGGTTHSTSFSVTINPRIITLTSNVNLNLHNGLVDPSCPHGCQYRVGQTVSISATPRPGWSFSGWVVAPPGAFCSGGTSVNLCVLVLPNNDVSVNAQFQMATMNDRAINVLYWLLGQEVSYAEGKTGFAAAISGIDQNRAYTDDNARLAMALTYELEYLHEASQESSWCGQNQNCPNLYDKTKVAVQFVLDAQTTTNDFYHYWNLIQVNPGWQESGKLYSWNAAVLEGLAIVAMKMRWKGLSPQADYAFYDHVIQAVEKTLDTYQASSQNSDGSWAFVYQTDQGEKRDTQLAENGILLAALVAVSNYELDLNLNVRKAQTYDGWADSIANWILGLQENHQDRQWSYGGGYGGFYSNIDKVEQASSANGRAVFGLGLYGFDSASIFQYNPAKTRIKEAMQLWLDDWVGRTHDPLWGPINRVTSSAPTPYPQDTYAAAALGTATAAGYNFFQDNRYKTWANNFLLWSTEHNEKNLDFQDAWDGDQSHVGFFIGIQDEEPNHADHPVDVNSNVETNAEMLQLMVALNDPSILWNLSSSSTVTTSPASTTHGGSTCAVNQAASGSFLEAPVSTLRQFRDNQVNRTSVGSAFLSAFNYWYYSWSPSVAHLEEQNPVVLLTVRALVTPAIEVLIVSRVSYDTFQALGREVSVIAFGITASALIGIVYLSPVIYVASRLIRRKITFRSTLWIGCACIFLVTAATLKNSAGSLGAATSLLVVETLFLASLIPAVTPKIVSEFFVIMFDTTDHYLRRRFYLLHTFLKDGKL